MTELHTDSLTPENASPGRTLAAAREGRGLAVHDVAQRLKFAPRQIEALEADRYDALPGAVFVRGMIRSYAKLLDLDAATLVDRVERGPQQGAGLIARGSMDVPFPAGERRGSRAYLVLSLVVAVAVIFVVVDWVLREREAAMEARVRALAEQEHAAVAAASAKAPAASTPPTTNPAASAEAASASVATAENAPRTVDTVAGPSEAPQVYFPQPAPATPQLAQLRFAFDRDSWVEVKDAEGNVLTSQINRGGSERTIEGKLPLSLVIGNASGVHLRLNGQDVDLAPHTRVDVARLTLEQAQ